jgi:hypothetical protein
VALVALVPAPDLVPAGGDVVSAQRPADAGLGPPLHLLQTKLQRGNSI